MSESGTALGEPLEILASWLEQAREAGVSAPGVMTVATATTDGRPSARVVSLKRLDGDGLVFTTALWTRKAEELRLNPQIASVFHWPALGRQARIEGRAEMESRELAEELFSSRPRDHRLQALVSRQGETIESIERLRERLARLRSEAAGRPIACPSDWGAVRIVPDRIEFWEEAADRLHDRQLYEAVGDGWSRSRLAP